MGYSYTFKIVILGDSAVKTAFFTPLESSTGLDFYSKTIELDGTKIKLQLWVICSEERFKFLVPTYARGANGAIFMYDIGNHNSLAHIGEWLVLIRKELRSEDLFPIVLAGVSMGSEEDREITSDEGLKVANKYNLDGFIECIAKTGEHVDEMFEELVKMLIQKSELRDWVSEIRFSHKKEKEISEIDDLLRKKKTKTLKIWLLGDSAAKTALVKNYCYTFIKPSETPTTGLDFKTIWLDGSKIKLWLWNRSGEERSRFLPTYARGANGALFVYDVANYSSLAHIDDWLMLIRKEFGQEDMFPIIMVGVVPELDAERQISVEEARKIAQSSGLDGFAECNPRTGENVKEIFETITRLIIQ